MKLRLTMLLISSFLVSSASAQTPSEVTVLRAARMLDVVAGEIVKDAVVVIEGERIVSVNPSSTPGGAKILDLGDVTLLPGLMDLHTHLVHDLEPGFWMLEVVEGPADVAYRSVGNARKTLMAGFTTVRDFGGQVTVALSRAEEKGRVQSPRVIPSRNSLGITGGHCDATGFAPGIRELGPEEGIADGVDEVIEAVRYQIKHGAKVIKTCATAGVLSFEGPVGAQQYSYEELRAMVEEAERHGVKVAAHAHGTEGIIAAVRAGVASIEHGSMLDDEAIRLMKKKGTYLVPTTYLADSIDLDALPPLIRAKAEYVMPIAKESLRRAIRKPASKSLSEPTQPFIHMARTFWSSSPSWIVG